MAEQRRLSEGELFVTAFLGVGLIIGTTTGWCVYSNNACMEVQARAKADMAKARTEAIQASALGRSPQERNQLLALLLVDADGNSLGDKRALLAKQLISNYRMRPEEVDRILRACYSDMDTLEASQKLATGRE